MGESDGRLAPVSYLPGVRPPSDDLPTLRSVFGAHADRDADGEADGSTEAGAGFAGIDDSCARLVDAADRERDERSAERAAAKAARRAENVALAALTRRGQSRREIERTLRQRELDEETIADEVARLESVGLIDDVALAQQLVGSLQERKGLGRSAIAAELTRRMLAPAAIEYGLELVDSGDELARARELARKRVTQLRGLDRETAARRLSGYLQRRGYSGSTVRSAVDSALPATATAGGSVRFR